jgi:hypothetical protein
VSTELYPSSGCCTVACLHGSYMTVGLHVTVFISFNMNFCIDKCTIRKVLTFTCFGLSVIVRFLILSSLLKMETVSSYETSVSAKKATRCRSPEDHTLESDYRNRGIMFLDIIHRLVFI